MYSFQLVGCHSFKNWLGKTRVITHTKDHIFPAKTNIFSNEWKVLFYWQRTRQKRNTKIYGRR